MAGVRVKSSHLRNNKPIKASCPFTHLEETTEDVAEEENIESSWKKRGSKCLNM